MLKLNIFVVVCVVNLEGNRINDNLVSFYMKNEIVSAIILQFSELHIMFHFDDETSDGIHNVLKDKYNNRSYFMINYDRNPEKNGILKRPPGYNYLHVVFLIKYQQFDRYE